MLKGTEARTARHAGWQGWQAEQTVPGPSLESWTIRLQELRHMFCRFPYYLQQPSSPGELACTHIRALPQRRSSPRQPHLSSAHHLDTTGCVLLTFFSLPSQKAFTANPRPPDRTMGLACPYRYR